VAALGGQASGTTVFRLEGDFSLKVDPAEPLAGRDVFFTLDGLLPWQEVIVEFADPRGAPAQWVTEEEVLLVDADGGPAAQRQFHADGSGQVSWLRVGTRDQEGVWSVRITIDGETSDITYPVDQPQLADQDMETVGVALRRYQGTVSNTYSSTLVPGILPVDLQSHLAWAMDRLEDSLGVRTRQIPDIYLAGNSGLLQQIAQATGDDIGFEDGYYRSGGTRPGIYLRTDFFRSSLQGIVTHEFVHLLLVEIAGGQALPAWLNEGMARYYEYELGLLGTRPDAVRVSLFRDTDQARSATLSNNLLSLAALESQSGWNSQTEESRIGLQYAEAYMAVRFLIETYGAGSALEMVRIIERGTLLPGAILEVTGSQYRDFRDQFAEWLGDWTDPERALIREYIQPLEGITDSVDSISARRSVDLASGAPLSSRLPVKRGLAADATALLAQAEGLSPPSTLQELHQEALAYLGAVADWLNLELAYAETRVDTNLIQANDMIPEINARDLSLIRAIITTKFVYNIQ
tara:strand:- start:5086 stop:6645 length:1560 start_codon:yes stop_codon:yes gene_type:complete